MWVGANDLGEIYIYSITNIVILRIKLKGVIICLSLECLVMNRI